VGLSPPVNGDNDGRKDTPAPGNGVASVARRRWAMGDGEQKWQPAVEGKHPLGLPVLA